MNGGFANRPGFSIAPPGGVGAHVMRDLRRLIAIRDDVLNRLDLFDEDGLALVWLRPWDGTNSLSPKELNPYYVEICRRVRLIERDGGMSALAAGSKVARISFGKDANGLTGDPWTPIEAKDGEAKALTVDARGFSYKRLSDILFENGFQHAPLQLIGPGDRQDCAYVALARGQGKTEGLHERRIVVPPKAAGYWRSGELEPLAWLSRDRIEQAGKLRSALRYALMVLFQNGPDRADFKPRDPSSDKRAGPFLAAFEAEVDRDFFERLFGEFEADGDAAQHDVRKRWLLYLRERGGRILKTAETGSPASTVRRHRAWVRAEQALNDSFFKAFRNPYFPKADAHAAS